MLAAQVPNRQDTPKTQISGNYVVITWTQPFDGASPITAYKIRIGQQGNTLKAAPYSLDWGVGVYAIVSAINVVGPSVFSPPTLTADAGIILTNPDAPKNV